MAISTIEFINTHLHHGETSAETRASIATTLAEIERLTVLAREQLAKPSAFNVAADETLLDLRQEVATLESQSTHLQALLSLGR